MTNPLLEPSQLKHAALNFSELKPEHFAPAMEQALATGRQRLEELKAKPASFENTLRGLEHASEEIEFIFGTFGNLLIADANETLQSLATELGPKVAAFSNDVILDPVIFAKVDEVFCNRKSLNLSAEQLQLVEKVHREFSRSGAALDPAGKLRLREIDARLSQLHPQFRDNVLKATNSFELWLSQESDLAGLPESARVAAAEAARAKGRPQEWLFTLHAPSLLPFLRFADSRPLREKMHRAFTSRAVDGPYNNEPLIREIVDLAQEKARLLGAPSFAHHALQLRMAETPEQVLQFLDRLRGASMTAARAEVAEVQAFAISLGGPEQLQAWDMNYYSEKLKEQKYAIDEASLRPYFQLENVLDGVFEHARRLFNLKFTESKEYPVYHPEVRVFEVHRAQGQQEFVGLFYTDFFPRESKGQGAWMTNFFEQGHFRQQKIRPHVSIVCNFTPPTDTQPSLLTFDEVKTLFHEFGHALHSLLSNVQYRTLAGTNVYLDFVELPSQIFENWAEEEESLKLFAHHFETKEPIPLELVAKLKRAQKFQTGYFAIRQLNFAYLDLAWFSNSPPPTQTMAEFESEITKPLRLLPEVPNSNISAGFTHIFGGGYASGYYSYKWAEALDADAFELFLERGIFDPETAQRFEECILSKGGSDHPMRLYEKFRGRAPDPDALLRRDGLIS